MANRKVKPSEDYYDFLPQRVQESTKIKTISEKNVLATLCYEYLSHSIYASEHNGWFYCTLKEIMEGANIEFAQVKRIMTKLEIQKLIERKPGTTHHPSHYRLHPKIVELLPKVEGDFTDNEPQLGVINTNEPQDCSSLNTNEPQVEKPTVEIPNEPQDKIRLDKSSKDLDSLIYNSTDEDDASILAKIEASSTKPKINESEFYEHWKNELINCKSVEKLKETLMRMVSSLPSRDAIREVYLESLKDLYDRLQCQLKFKEQKKK